MQLLRRLVNLVLLLLAGLLLAWAARRFEIDPPRAAVVAAVGAFGVCLNLIGIGRRQFAFPLWLRGLACLVALVGVAAVLGRWYLLTYHELPDIPKSETGLRQSFERAAYSLLWVAGALGYIAAALLALPPAPRGRAALPARAPTAIVEAERPAKTSQPR